MSAIDEARILHLFANYKWTGPADPAIRSVARLRGLGLDATFAQAGFVHRGGEHRVAEELWNRAVPVVAGLELRKHFHVPSLLRDVRTLRAILQRGRYAIVHCHLPADHLLAALACRAMPKPPLLVRTLYEPVAPARGWRERFGFRRTAGAIAPTAAARDGLLGSFHLDPARVLLQGPVTEPQSLDGPDLRARWGLDASHRIVGITARVQPHRRFDLLWDIARLVVSSLPNARVVLLGRGNPTDTQNLVLDPVARLGLQQHVVLPGYQKGPDYAAALRSLDAFLFLVPGSDGTCRAVGDALAFGLPVVATRRGILPALLAERRAGETPGVTCAEQAAPMADALLQLLRDDGLRAARRAAALRVARLDMDPKRAARALRAFYERLLAAGGGRR